MNKSRKCRKVTFSYDFMLEEEEEEKEEEEEMSIKRDLH